MKIKIIKISIIVFSVFAIISCDGGKMTEKVTYDNLKDVPASSWKALSEKKIYFGHQSVGFNIMDGVADLMKEYPDIKLNIVETKEASKFNKGVFAHSRVGENVDPSGKINDFKKIIESGIGRRADAVALKFCYVDMTGQTDIESLLQQYIDSVDKIKKKYPGVTIIHFTEPLTMSKTTWKTWIKKMMGKKDLWEYNDNIKRNQYNALLLEKYQGREPILDIAKIESTYPDGKRESFTVDGNIYHSMVPDYTRDGGHLNEIGRRKVAEAFLLLLTNLKS